MEKRFIMRKKLIVKDCANQFYQYKKWNIYLTFNPKGNIAIRQIMALNNAKRIEMPLEKADKQKQMYVNA